MASRSGTGSVARWVAGGVVCVLIVALSGLSGAVPAVLLDRSGHWLYSNTLGALFHIDGGSNSVDAKTPLVGLSPGASAGTDGKRIYVSDSRNGRIIVFGQSDLRQQTTQAVGTHEQGIFLQVAGGPYVVYPDKGAIIRYGAHYAKVDVGSSIGRPMATTDGTLWVRRLDDDRICKLTPTSDKLTCTSDVVKGHQVELVALDDQPGLLDLSSGKVARLDGSKGGAPVKDVPRSGNVSATDAGGRLAVVTGDAQHPQLRLLDTSAVGSGRSGGTAIKIPLPAGKYDAPTTAGNAIVLVNQTTHTITTYDNGGTRKSVQRAAGETQPLRVNRGEDGLVYVDNTAGTKSYRVAGDGSIKPIDTANPGPGDGPALPPKKSSKPSKPTPSKSAKPTAKPSSGTGSGGSSSGSPSEPTSGSGEDSDSSSASRPGLPSRLPSVSGLPTGKSTSGGDRTTTPDRSGAPKTKSTTKPKSNRGNGGNGGGGTSSTANPPRKQKPQRPEPPTNGDNGGNGGNTSAPVGNGGNDGGNNGGGNNVPKAPPAERPDAPASVNVTPKIKVADVSWTKPSNNGAKITGYRVTWQGGSKLVKSGTSTRITGLKAETQYTVSVAARNKVGLGKSTSRTFTTKKQPAPPFQFTAQAKANADGSVTISWNAYPGVLTYAVTRHDKDGDKQLTGQNGYYQTTFTTTDVTPGQPVTFTVLAYKLLVQFGTAQTNQVTPQQQGGAGGGGGGNQGQAPNGATPVNGLDWSDKGGGNIEFCWSKPDYLGEDNAQLVGYHVTVEGGQTYDYGPDASDATVQVPNRGHNKIDVQAITTVPGWPDKIYGMHSYTEGESNFVEIPQAEAPEVVLNKVTLGADHVLTVDMHLHDHGSPTRITVVVDEKIVYGPQVTHGGDGVLRIPDVVVQKGKTVDVQVGSSSDGGTGNVAKARVTAQ